MTTESMERFVNSLKSEMLNSNFCKMSCFRQVIIAGSYADWLKNKSGVSSPSWKAIPDINIYIIVDASPAEEITAMTALGKIYRSVHEIFPELSLLLDLHPFSLSVNCGDILPETTLQVTSRIINVNGYYPDYCWWGWKSNYVHLLGDDFISTMDVHFPVRDEAWIKNMHMAFASYSNVMYMIALSSLVTSPLIRFDEAYRYLKEVIKDGISLGLSVKDYPNFNYSVIKEWKNKTDSFYEKFYGPEEAAIVKHVLDIEQNYFSFRTEENADSLQEMFCTLHAAVYEKGFKARAAEICGSNGDWRIPKWY